MWHACQVRLELQAGHSEQGVARIQAALEFACLAPPELPGAQGPHSRLHPQAAAPNLEALLFRHVEGECAH